MQLKVPLKHAEHDHVKREPGGPSPDERKLQNNFRTGWSTQSAPGTPSPRVSEGRPSPAKRGAWDDPAGGLVLVTPRFTTLPLLPLATPRWRSRGRCQKGEVGM